MITIVSGLPRSGTSLMMQILEKGGMEILTDNLRKADESNQKGYYEYEKVKSLMKDQSWIGEAEGKVLKVVSGLLTFLPDTFDYKIFFMMRDMDEILSSQSKMLDRMGISKKVDPKILKMTFEKQVRDVKKLLSEKNNIEFLDVSYRDLVMQSDNEISKINDFLGNTLVSEKMSAVIDKNLYREKVGRIKS